MGTTRIKVIDLSADVEQIKTSRKRAQTAAVKEIKKPLVSEKKAQKKPKKAEGLAVKPQVVKKIIEENIQPQEAKIGISKLKVTQKRSKKYQNAKLLIDQSRLYPITEALELAKKVNIAKFDGNIEAHIIVKQRGLRGSLTLPHPVGKAIKILVFAKDKLNLPKNGITVGNEKTIEEIATKKLTPKRDFNLVIATPEFMPKLASIGKFLGPAGLMPNPKSGTVTEKPEEVIKKISSGFTEFKTETNAPVIHFVIGKTSQDFTHLKENFQAVVSSISPQKIVKLYLAPTMGPSVKVDLTSLST